MTTSQGRDHVTLALLGAGFVTDFYMQALASVLAADGDRLDDLRKGFPTAALAEVDIPAGSWAELAPGSGRLERFIVPRELGSG